MAAIGSTAEEMTRLELPKQNGAALEWASPALKADKCFVLDALQCGAALEWAAPKLWADREVVLAAVQCDRQALQWASPELQADKDVVLEAVKLNGHALCHASPHLKEDMVVVLEAVAQDRDALVWASHSLRRGVLKTCIEGLLAGVHYREVAEMSWATVTAAAVNLGLLNADATPGPPQRRSGPKSTGTTVDKARSANRSLRTSTEPTRKRRGKLQRGAVWQRNGKT
jgi:hypothetical protein